MKLFYRVWSTPTGNPITPTINPHIEPLEVPRGLLIQRLIVACETSPTQHFFVTLLTRDPATIPMGSQHPTFWLVPRTGASGGVVEMYDGIAPYVLPPGQSQLWLRLSGSGIEGKTFAVSIAGMIDTPR